VHKHAAVHPRFPILRGQIPCDLPSMAITFSGRFVPVQCNSCTREAKGVQERVSSVGMFRGRSGKPLERVAPPGDAPAGGPSQNGASGARSEKRMQPASVVGTGFVLGGYRAIFTCRCGKPVFFRNSECLACKAALGYEPRLGMICAIEPAEAAGQWRLSSGQQDSSLRYLRCANFNTASGCNWLVNSSAEGPAAPNLCQCCRLDRTIPDLSVAQNVESFWRISVAKRRLVSLLAWLRLPLISRADDPEHGLAFDFLQTLAGGPQVMTGHADGIVTLNIAEAEDATREQTRNRLGEPYRTLLGHLRHETGHYYWDRLIAETRWIEMFRQVFGDERQDYEQALQTHYKQGAPPDWRQRFVSAYASSHPWEDWAETWAHYLHIVDTTATARSFGLDPEAAVDLAIEPFNRESLCHPEDPGADAFLAFINSWIRLTAPLNELSRGMGLADFYPFVLSKGAVGKLQLVHLVVSGSQLPVGICSA
jgi:hypothetical protein